MNLKFIIAAVVLLGALFYLGFIAFQSATVYSYTVTELTELGPTPEGFNPHSEIILEGTYRPDGVFDSQNVLVKCPSKYIEATEDGTTYDQSAYSKEKGS